MKMACYLIWKLWHLLAKVITDSVLAFVLHCYAEFDSSHVSRRNYNLGDYQGMCNELAVDWDTLLHPLQNDLDAQFTLFCFFMTN